MHLSRSASIASILICGAVAGSIATAAFAKPPSASAASGKKVYAANKCGSCHKIAGTGGPVGPDLSKEGANAKHTAAWLQVEIQNPKAHKPDGKMPAYKDKIAGADLSNLVAYLRSLK